MAPSRSSASERSFSNETSAAASLGVITSSVSRFAAMMMASSIPCFLQTFRASRKSEPMLIWCLKVMRTQVEPFT